ncbi:G-protein coupled receptor Mth-like [Centruroides vittatus]|uniref:G-protein coupled receptor Mth-like n=1 Tax=Centruroides vittatus TaxID=120091 RepID=UPI00350FC305
MLIRKRNMEISNVNKSNISNTFTNKTYCLFSETLELFIIISLILSIICIIITIIIYNCISELNTLHGKILKSLSACLGTTYSLLLLDFYLKPYVPYYFCITLGILTYFIFMATFYWTNVMTYDLWKTLSTMMPKSQFFSGNKYCIYSIYAWIASILTSMPIIVIQNTKFVTKKFHPKIGKNTCWITGRNASIIYLSIPVGVILFANLVMFILTTKALIKVKNTTKILKINQGRNTFKLYIKLFLVMGLVWFTEFIPFIYDECHLDILTDILNSLHGLFLFLIFICKRKIFRNLSSCFHKYRYSLSTSERKSFELKSNMISASKNTENFKSITTNF